MKEFRKESKSRKSPITFTSIIESLSSIPNQIARLSENISNSFTQTSQELKSIVRENNLSLQFFNELENQFKAFGEFIGKGKEHIIEIISIVDLARKSIRELDKEVKNTTERTIQAVELFENLSKHSKSIGEIVNVVSTVAEQTTLLAFNAAIEAAKAGEYGNGFAVVADEVRTLAKTSDKSVKEIETLISETSTNISSITEDIHKLRLLANLNKRKTEIIDNILNKISATLLEFKMFYEDIDNIIRENQKILDSSKNLVKIISNEIDPLITNAMNNHSHLSDFSTKVSMDIKLLLNTIEHSGIKSGEIAYSENLISLIEKISLTSTDSKIKKNINSILIEMSKKIIDTRNSFFELVNKSKSIRIEGENKKSFFDNFNDLNKSILIEASKIRATDHIIYNEMFENSIRDKKVYEGQLSATRCAFGKWFMKYKPHNEQEKNIYNEIAKAHELIHHYQAESVEFMKQNKFKESEEIFKEKILHATDDFIQKLSELYEGIVIVGTGFKYITNLFEKTNGKIHELSIPFGKISKVVTVIENIRIQTNMLAVCGTIEAARAGEHGKGFAFVGGDIKNLASETKENNEKIKDLLDQIYELLDQAKKDFSEVNLLIITQDKEADISLDFLTKIEKMISQSDNRAEDINIVISKIASKIEKHDINLHSITNLFNKTNKIIQDNGEAINNFFMKTDELEKKLDTIEVSLLSEK